MPDANKELKPCPHPEAPCNECCTCNGGSSSGDARVLDELEKWLSEWGGGTDRPIKIASIVKAKLSELRTTAQAAEDGLREVAKEAAELLDKFSTYFAHAEKREPRKEAEAMADRLEACLSVPAPQTSAEELLTSDELRKWMNFYEAIKESIGMDGIINAIGKHHAKHPVLAEADKAPQTSAERDYTPEEALAEARRRWPMFNRMVASVLIQSCFDGTWEYVVRQPLGVQYCGDTFRAAFAEASRVSGKEEK